MEPGRKNRSLLPYLDPSTAPIHLKITLVTEDQASLESVSSPFRVLTDSDPLTRIVGARFLTDTDFEVKKVFLLLQKDKYALPKDSLRPFYNKEVEASWQNAFSYYSRADPNGSLIVLKNQLDRKGELVPLGSLFFCKSKQTFFGPPCSSCGRPLELCYDDDLLGQLGLPAYSTSLNRYVFCASCWDSEDPSYLYTYELEGLETSLVKDWRGLVKDFTRLKEKGLSIQNFPCCECPNHGTCYGTGGLATSRIVPFSFYPFFMLIFEDMPLNASEFLPLISGASLEDLEAWIRDRGEFTRFKSVRSAVDKLSDKTFFFFEGEKQHFLEILYLKLTFLAELFQLVLPDRDRPIHPDMRFNLDNTWVKLGDKAGLIPGLWNFKVRLIGIAANLPETSLLPGIPSVNVIHFLGLAWFYTLLTNKKQDTSLIYQSLKRALERTSPEKPFFWVGVSEDTFRPENLFWNPEGKTIDESWRAFWEEALLLGSDLFQVGSSLKSNGSSASFSQRLTALRGQIRHQLFADDDRTSGVGRSGEDEVLHTIIKNIMERWEKQFDTGDTALGETVVISPKGPGDERAISDVEQQVALEETVISSPGRIADERLSVAGESEQVDLKETIVVSSGAGKDHGSTPLRERGKEDVPETVILSPGKEPHGPPREPSMEVLPEERQAHQEKRSIQPGPAEEKIDKTRQKREDNFLTETVFISPRQGREREKDKKE